LDRGTNQGITLSGSVCTSSCELGLLLPRTKGRPTAWYPGPDIPTQTDIFLLDCVVTSRCVSGVLLELWQGAAIQPFTECLVYDRGVILEEEGFRWDRRWISARPVTSFLMSGKKRRPYMPSLSRPQLPRSV